MMKPVLSLLLTLVMVLSLSSVSVLAQEEPGAGDPEVTGGAEVTVAVQGAGGLRWNLRAGSSVVHTGEGDWSGTLTLKEGEDTLWFEPEGKLAADTSISVQINGEETDIDNASVGIPVSQDDNVVITVLPRRW